MDYWPLGVRVKAGRSSRSRTAGILETKSYSFTMESYKSLFLNSDIPTARNKFSRHRSQKIIVQHDNASFCNDADNEKFLVVFNEALTVKTVFQLSNSPDFTVLDLGFFIHLVSLESNKCYYLWRTGQCHSSRFPRNEFCDSRQSLVVFAKMTW